MLRAQLFVDNGGPRDIFFDATTDGKKLNGFVGKFDSAEKSLSASYFGRPKGVEGNVLFGLKAKVDAVDGLDELVKLEHWPRAEISFLGNWYGRSSDVRSGNPFLWSITPRLAGSYAEYELVSPDTTVTPRKVGVERFTAGAATVTFSGVVPWGDGIALNVGVERTSNYDQLTKVEITETGGKLADGTAVEGSGKKRTVRVGRLEKTTSYPLHLTYVTVFGFTKVARQLPSFDESSAYDLLVAPYGKVSAGSGNDSANAAGINFTLRRLSNVGPGGTPPAGKDFNDQKLSFPYAFFVERRNVLGNKASETKAGAAVVFAWK